MTIRGSTLTIFAFLISTLSHASDLSFVNSDVPVLRLSDQQLYLYAGNKIKGTPDSCYVMLQIKRDENKASLIGIADEGHTHWNLTTPHSNSFVNSFDMFRYSVDLVGRNTYRVNFGERGLHKHIYDLKLDNESRLASFTESHHETMVFGVLQGDDPESTDIECLNLKNISDKSQVSDNKNIQDKIDRFIGDF